MITTITLNAAIDKTYYINGYKQEGINRVDDMFSEPGGKGNNVAKVLHTLGSTVITSGFIAGHNGRWIREALASLDLPSSFVEVEGESRLCLNIIDQLTGSSTEILEKGPVISDKDWQRFKYMLPTLINDSEIIVMSGSLAKGMAPNAYAELVEIINQHGKKAVVDTSGPALKEAIDARPFLIKPNFNELCQVMNVGKLNMYDLKEVMHSLHGKGIAMIVVSMGEKGVIAEYDNRFFLVTPPKIKAINPVGCGDAMVAGFVYGIGNNLSIEETLILGTAAATANALELKAGQINLAKLEHLKAQVKVEQVRY